MPKKTTSQFPRDLENLSIDELQAYISELESEITRVKGNIEAKKASQNAASAIFK